MTNAEHSAKHSEPIRPYPLVASPSRYGPQGCSYCDWGKADVAVLGRSVCKHCAWNIAAEITAYLERNHPDDER